MLPTIVFLALLSLASVPDPAQCISVMSIDLGSEWMKIGIVSPGVPMEIVLNKESKRKTPAVISFHDSVRTFGEDAQTVGIRFPKKSFSYLLDLVGKSIDNPVVKLYQKRFPYHELIEDKKRKTILFKSEDNIYSPEELIAQLLQKAKEYAEKSVEQPVNECVLTVPGYFNQAERQALLQAAQLANLKVLQLINDYTAVALNYGIFRRKDFNETVQYVMFYDMGASSTTATVVGYQVVKIKERGFVETHPQLTVIGVGYDRTLGGLDMQLRLRDYLGKKFNEMKKTTNDVFKNPRAMAKLFKEAGRLKNVLSANADHVAQVEGLLDEQDFRLQVTREQFEELCQDLFDRVGNPVKKALDMAGLSMDVIGQVILVGAGTRVPKVQEMLQKTVDMELSKNINTDEAATMGAVYRGADLSTGFKVKKFIMKDGVLFPIQVVFDREGRQIRRTLFNLMNPYPQKKIITFNKHTDDFSFDVNYADLSHLSRDELANLGSLNLSHVDVAGVAQAFLTNKGENIESKGIKAHFATDDSGILSLTNIEATFEKTVAEEEAQSGGTLSKLGSTISRLFTSGQDQEPETKQNEEAVNKTATNETTSTPPSPSNRTSVVPVREALEHRESVLVINIMSTEQMQASIEKLERLNAADRDRTRRETALNNLESFAIDILSKLDTDEFTDASDAATREKIREQCSHISDWLYEDGSDADAITYEKKYADMKMLTADLFQRVFEHRERPEALKSLDQMMNASKAFLESAKNLTKTVNPDKDVFTDVEIETLSKIITETSQWKIKNVQLQDKQSKSEPVVLTVKMIMEKMSLLDREVKYLVNKLKIWRPKKVEKEKSAETNNSTTEVPDDSVTPAPTDSETESPTKADDTSKTKEEKESETIEVEPNDHQEEEHQEL